MTPINRIKVQNQMIFYISLFSVEFYRKNNYLQTEHSPACIKYMYIGMKITEDAQRVLTLAIVDM